MKKEIKVALTVLLALVVFLGGVVVGATNGGLVRIEMVGGASQSVDATNPPATNPPATNPPATNPPATEPPASSDAGTTAPPASDAPATDAPQNNGGLTVPSTTEEVCAAYNKAINDYKAFKGVVTHHKVENTQVNITDLPSVAKPLEGTLNSVIGNIVKPVDETFTFENGVDPNDTTRTIMKKIIPFDREANVTAADVSSATATANADGGYTINLQFVSETSSFDGTNTTNPVHHMTAMDPLNLATLDISPLTISDAQMSYSGATTALTVDAQGRIIKLENKLPLEGSGTGGMGFIKATIGLAGQMDSVYTMEYK